MTHNPMRARLRAPLLTAALAAAALTLGCATAGDPPPETAADETTEKSSEKRVQEPQLEENDTGCMIGQWALDLDDYGSQSYEWLLSIGIPIDYLHMSGSQTLSITHELFGIGSDLHTDASVMGQPIPTVSQFAGSGEWWWSDDGSPAITITDWHYTVDPPWADPAAPAAPPLFDPAGSEPILASCDGDSLSLKGADAPLAGNFTRVG